MIGHTGFGRLAAVLVLGFAVLLLISGAVAANNRVWTTQADFQSGTLTDVNATTAPGNLVLGTNATAFAPYAGNPVFGPSTGGWDSAYAIASTVLRIGGTWVMWYSGSNGSNSGIGRATSTDGINWTRNPTTPLFTSYSWPDVLYESGVYKMWYEYTPGPYMPTAIDYATSTDGINWTPYPGNPVLSPSASGFDSFIVAPGGVVHDASGYRMWYPANDGSSVTYATGLATSPDGINWTRYAGNPVITPPFGGWFDSERVLSSAVIPWKGGLLMGYVGADSSFMQRIALATSSDGIHWTPPSAPTLDIGAAGSWDSRSLSHFSLVNVSGNLTMWYGGGPSYGVFSTGLATAPAYAAEGTFVSGVIDSGQNGTTWASLTANATTPAATQVQLMARAGNTPTPDGNWSGWTTSSLPGGALPYLRSRYAQVGVTLMSSDGVSTPVLEDVTLGYALDRAAPPTLAVPSVGSWTSNTSETFTWTFVDPDAGDIQGGYELQMSADAAFATISFDTGATTAVASQATVSLPATDGSWYWRVRTQDNWGNWGPYSAANLFKIDRTPPSVIPEFGSPMVMEGGTRFITSQTLITLTASDGSQGIGVGAVVYSIDTGFPHVYSVPFRMNGTDGPHFILYTAADLLLNVLAPRTLNVTLDDTGPTLTLGLSSSSDGYQITANATDAGSGVSTVYVSIDHGPWSAYSGPVFVESAGNHVVQAYAVDRLGNIGATQSVTIVIPNVQPFLAGSIGVVGLFLGLVLLGIRKGPRSIAFAVAAVLGIVGLGVGIASAGTGLLGIPPWLNAPLLIDVLLSIGIAVALVVGWRARPAIASPPAPVQPPPGPP